MINTLGFGLAVILTYTALSMAINHLPQGTWNQPLEHSNPLKP
ncbi:MAG TPA: hypothetical protein V6D11_12325 [Waterburya sp.]|jgi:hypothetical protein